MDARMAEMGEKVPFRKKINSILIEACQNLMHHAPSAADFPPRLQIEKVESGYQISTGNLITKSKAEKLARYIDKINLMSRDELREFYQKVLTNGKISAAGGGGLGILNIARKTVDNRVSYSSQEVSEETLFFNMRFVV